MNVCDADGATICVKGVVFDINGNVFGVDWWMWDKVEAVFDAVMATFVGDPGASCNDGASCSIDGVSNGRSVTDDTMNSCSKDIFNKRPNTRYSETQLDA